MEIRYAEVRDCARKVGAVGEEVREFLDRARSGLDAAAEGNEGFTAVDAFRDVAEKLHRQSTAVGDNTVKSAAALAAAADDHERTDLYVRGELAKTREALGDASPV
ncbi:hypothetical protein AB0I28_33610 [Phytomonospora sp. NPDC050363]|uniref:hypothetical protein n=1 Tax=Phytomonospora sp. NPDC050363 TaxID=3155642 RepID=UPI0033CAA36B